MTQKTISLPEEVYLRLKKKKKDNETYSDLICRLLETKKKGEGFDISKFFGMLEEDDEDEWERIEKELYSDRLIASRRHKYSLDD